MPKILIFTPTWVKGNGEYAIYPLCMESIQAQQTGPDVAISWAIGLENPFPVGSHRNVLAQYQKAREALLHGDYDALLTVEHDNVLPDSGAVQRMWDTQGDVIYAPYQLRHGAFCLSTWRYENDHALGMPLNNYPEELAQFRAAGTGRICGCGMGCTLFRRHVLERLPFRGGDGQQWAPDIPFAQDALRAGFVSMGRFDVPVDHYDGDVRLEPFKWVEKMKFLATQTVNAIADGEWIALVAGQVYELRPRMASDLSRVGYIVSLPAEPVVEAATVEPAETAMLPRAKSKRAR